MPDSRYAPLVWRMLPLRPFAPITGHYGDDYSGSPHMGVDVGVPEGTPVYAPADGTVVAFTNDGSFGNGVCLDHVGTEWYSLYAHLERPGVHPLGAQVKAGDLIGYTGNTGKSTGPHLHWQVCKLTTFPKDPAQNIDPLSFPVVPIEDEPAPQEPAPSGVTEARVREIVDEAIAAQFRPLMRAYWTTVIGGDFTDPKGSELPPDEDVVDAIAAATLEAWASKLRGGK